MQVNFAGGKLTPAQCEMIEQSIVSVFSKYQSGDRSDWQINVAILSKDKAKDLNQKFASNDYATDVLSFNYQEDKQDIAKTKNFGDIAICLPIAKANAKKNKLSLSDELARLSTHASLHLLGYDHQDSSQQTRFSTMQDDIISSLNI